MADSKTSEEESREYAESIINTVGESLIWFSNLHPNRDRRYNQAGFRRRPIACNQ